MTRRTILIALSVLIGSLVGLGMCVGLLAGVSWLRQQRYERVKEQAPRQKASGAAPKPDENVRSLIERGLARYSDDRRRVFEMAPNISAFINGPIHTNRFGYRCTDHEVAKPAGAFRIFFLGDSETFGGGLTDEANALPRIVETMLNRVPGMATRYECFNLGVLGYNTLAELAVLEENMRFGPDLVVVQFVANDCRAMPSQEDRLLLAAAREGGFFWQGAFRGAMDGMRQLCQHNHCPLYLLTCHHPYSIAAERRDEVVQQASAICREMGIPVVDPFGALVATMHRYEQTDAEFLNVYPEDGHSNSIRNRIKARVLVEGVLSSLPEEDREKIKALYLDGRAHPLGQLAETARPDVRATNAEAVDQGLRKLIRMPAGFESPTRAPERPYELAPGRAVTIQHEAGAVRYAINAVGYRGKRRPLAKPAGVFRVGLFGGSVVFGVGLDESETLAKKLEARLAGRPALAGRAVEVMNLGLPRANLILSLATRSHLMERGLETDVDVLWVDEFYDQQNGWHWVTRSWPPTERDPKRRVPWLKAAPFNGLFFYPHPGIFYFYGMRASGLTNSLAAADRLNGNVLVVADDPHQSEANGYCHALSMLAAACRRRGVKCLHLGDVDAALRAALPRRYRAGSDFILGGCAGFRDRVPVEDKLGRAAKRIAEEIADMASRSP